VTAGRSIRYVVRYDEVTAAQRQGQGEGEEVIEVYQEDDDVEGQQEDLLIFIRCIWIFIFICS